MISTNHEMAIQGNEAVVMDGNGLVTIEDIIRLATQGCGVALNAQADYHAHIERGAALVRDTLADGGVIYGVNTGYGDSCIVTIPPELVDELPARLVTYHGCGGGALLDEPATLAVLGCRLNALTRGYSGVRWVILEGLAQLINLRVLPNIPEEGSVGASGDLTPLSYIAAVLMGEREVTYKGEVREACDVLRELQVAPIRLAPKEGLALMNGTAVMTGLACLAWDRAEYLSRLATRVTALVALGLYGQRDHFHPRLFAVKPHQGIMETAAWLFADLSARQADSSEAHPGRSAHLPLQDRYSIRCAPHVIGVLRDALPWMRRDIENELNSVNDNPIVDPVYGRIFHGGHFYGGHIAFVMDGLKAAVASLADLMDRQLALLVDTKFNFGLPSGLSGASRARAPINHGFKGVQISVSAWTAEALKLTMPAASFSRSTEAHNQDKVSMGTIAARDCLRVLELTEQVAAAVLLAAVQGIWLRQRQGELSPDAVSPAISAFLGGVGEYFEFLGEDRRLDKTLRRTAEGIRAKHWALYPA